MSSVQTGDDTEHGVTATAANSGVKPELSQREQEVLMAAWLCIKGAEPQVDYDKLATFLGLKNGRSASTTFYLVKRKIQNFRDQAGDLREPQTSPLPKTSTTPRKRVAKTSVTPKSKKVAKVKSEDSSESTDDGI